MTTATTTPTAPPEAQRYLDAVADHLAGAGDLPPVERQELLDDLAAHLAEVVAEEGPAFEQRLGPPETYAEELLASAGVALSATDRDSAVVRRWEQVRRRAGDLWARPWVREARSTLRDLAPVWWVVRGYAATVLVDLVTSGGWGFRGPGFPFPRVFARSWPGVLLVLVLVAWSVRSGRRGRRRPSWSTSRRLVEGVAAVGCLMMLLFVSTGIRQRMASPPSFFSPSPAQEGQCLYSRYDKNPIENLFPYDAAGHPLTDVLLYDDKGRPIDNLCPGRRTEYAVDAGGRQVVNVFPRRQLSELVSRNGDVPSRIEVVPPPSVVPALPVTTTLARGQSPGGTPGAAPLPAGDAPTTPAASPTTTIAAPAADPSSVPASGAATGEGAPVTSP